MRALTLVLLCALPTSVSAQVVISEFMARNATTLLDENGDSSDWIELRNAGTQAVDLAGWSLTDDASVAAKWVFPEHVLAPGQYLIVFASGKNRAVSGRELHTSFQLAGAGEYLALLDGVSAVATEFAPQYPPQRVDVAYGLEGIISVLVADGAACDALVPTSGSLGTSWHGGTVTGWLRGNTGVGYETATGYEGLISLDLEQQMFEINGSAYVRMLFDVVDPSAFEGLTLRMKYDDGFGAFLNGQRITAANAPAVLAWNSLATTSNPDTAAVVFEDFDATPVLGALRTGTNVLAIHGLNSSTTSTDFLIVPELTGGRYGTQLGYLPSPTPGALNGSTVAGYVSDVAMGVERGFFSAPFSVSLSTQTAGATIRFTTDGSRPGPGNGTVYSQPIAIDRSTVLRAHATLSGYGASATSTHSYIFPRDVFSQPVVIPGMPTEWGGTGSNGPATTADYQMDPDVLNDPAYAPRLDQALRSHPVVCLAMDLEDWLDPATGIYISPFSSPTVNRESPTSVEYFEPQGSGTFQVDAGVRVTGNGSTWQWSTKKMSLRLLFKSQYGPSRLDYPLFAPPATTSFNTLTLDAYYAFTWNYAPYYNPPSEWRYRWRSAQYLRDWYATTLHRELGALATHGKYVHVFINGLYWGLFNIHERPDEDFQTSYRGGDPEDWDVIRHNQNNVQSGNRAAWLGLMRLVNQGGGTYVQTLAGYNAVKEMLDVQNLADYMLMNFFIGFHLDWPSSNWYSAKNRVDPQSRWQMFSWDAEHSLKDVTQNSTGFSTAGSPAEPYARLRQNLEFRVLFGDRVHRAFFNDGPMWVDPQSPAWNPAQPENNRPAALYASLANAIEDALILESARWGDVFTEPANTVNNPWKIERDRILNQYLPQRRGIVLQQLRAIGLYPNVAAPVFAQHGGTVAAGFALSMSAAAGTVYYTTDGTDPRLVGGDISPNAVAYSGPVVLNATTTVKARALDGGWSALNEATFVVEGVVLNELLASNVSGIVDEAGQHEDWIELFNKGASPVDAGGLYLTDDPGNPTKWQVPSGQLVGPGETLLVWADEDQSQGPLHANFKLASGGEQVQLFDRDGTTLLSEIRFGPQQPDISTGWMRDGGGQLLVTYPDPTPDRRNEVVGCGSRRYSAQDPTLQPLLLQATGTPALGQSVAFVMLGGQASTVHGLFLSAAPAEQALPSLSTSRLLIAQPISLLAAVTSGITGTAQVGVTVPPIPALAGVKLYLQGWTVVGTSVVGSSGLELVLCP